MCAPGCIAHLTQHLSRRSLLAAATAGMAAAASPTAAEARSPVAKKPPTARFPGFGRVVDLTHTHAPDFPTFDGRPAIALKRLKDIKTDGYNLMEWTVHEHSGTHIDAPIHFSAAGAGPAEIEIDRLVVPLAVIDVADKAAGDPDYRLSPDDIRAWERRHGRLPRRCCVAMQSGWDKLANSARYMGRDDRGVLHFPGFHPETSQMLIQERDVAGIAVDTLSLDHGPSKTFQTHTSWLPAGRWGLENVAGLSGVPARGATLVVGAPKIKGATGGPTRVMALV